MPGTLEAFRVLDLTGEHGFLAGKLLGDLGADVVKVEPPDGDPARRRPPFWGGAPDRERAVAWLTHNTSKRGITLDLDRPRGRELLLELADRFDVLLESAPPGQLDARGLGWSALHARNPRLIVCSITPWGGSGPRAGWRGSDLTALAASGNLHCTGDPERAPVRCALPVTHYHTGVEAAVGVLFALIARERTGEGQHVDVSLQQATIAANVGTASMARMNGNRGRRAGAHFRQKHSVQREIWPCRDGFVTFALRGGPARVPGLVRMVAYMDEHGMASEALRAKDWTRYNHNLATQDEIDAISAELDAFFRTRTMRELFAAACERNLMLAPANTAREVIESEQLAARGFFVDVDDPVRGTLRYPGAFALVTGAPPPRLRRPAPRLGEHTDEVLAELGLDTRALAALRSEGVL